ncbi:MAG: 4'-phosphopantetheinyl transferase family protein [Ginsengibacter sp.]
MTEVWYCNVTENNNCDFRSILCKFPAFMRADILRYHFERDRNVRTIARLLIQKYLRDKGFDFSLSDWRLDRNRKPYIEHGPAFNISHSGDLVVVAFDQTAVGIDIELIENSISDEIFEYLTAEEIAYINMASVTSKAFFHIWSRKEAYLKAIGDGIIGGISHISVVRDELVGNKNHWFLKEIIISKEYCCNICMKSETANIPLTKINF